MYCTNCGKPRPDDATVCPSCGARIRRPATQPAQTVPNYLVQSILVTLCCCLPFGIIAIVYAAQVNTKLAAGDVAGALQSSKNARMWAWIAFGCGALLSLIYTALLLTGNVQR